MWDSNCVCIQIPVLASIGNSVRTGNMELRYMHPVYFIFLHTQTMYAATNGMAADTYAMTFNVNRLEELL